MRGTSFEESLELSSDSSDSEGSEVSDLGYQSEEEIFGAKAKGLTIN
jgi:hypothetical protein